MQERLFEVSADLFAERGYAGTSLQDIAEAMDMSRPALYYYVKDKEQILERLVEELPTHDSKMLSQAAAEAPEDPTAKLRAIVKASVTRTVEVSDRFRLLDRSSNHLSGGVAKRYAEARRAVLATFQGIIEEGIAGGDFRVVDPRTAALAIIGMCNWVAWWYSPDAGGPEQIGDEIAELAVSSLVAGGGKDTTPAAVLKTIRGDLDRLERLI